MIYTCSEKMFGAQSQICHKCKRFAPNKQKNDQWRQGERELRRWKRAQADELQGTGLQLHTLQSLVIS